MKTKFNIGDTVYVPQHSAYAEIWVACPDCAGNLYHTITLGCGETHTIDCQNCARGYEAPTGRASYYDQKGYVEYGEIVGVEMTQSGFEYRVKGINYTMSTMQPFEKREDAQVKADEMAAKHLQEQKDRIYKKEKNTRSWAWNATYHRQCLKRAQRDIEYHSAKLDVAKTKAKEDKVA